MPFMPMGWASIAHDLLIYFQGENAREMGRFESDTHFYLPECATSI